MNNNANQYFEQLTKVHGDITEELLVGRMSQCNALLGEISNSPAWKILIEDARRIVKYLDDNWQHMEAGSDVFLKSRVSKMAYKTIIDVPNDYLLELQMIEAKLKEMQNTDIIEKDTDNN